MIRALELLATAGRGRGVAVDLGCGEGTDTAELLRAGWRVVAVDASEDGIGRTFARAESLGLSAALDTRRVPFEALDDLPPADLVYAAVSLPFCPPGHFEGLWQLVRNTVAARNGWIAAQFFGPNDSWADNPALTFHNREEVEPHDAHSVNTSR